MGNIQHCIDYFTKLARFYIGRKPTMIEQKKPIKYSSSMTIKDIQEDGVDDIDGKNSKLTSSS